jgi:undecaprenyl-diphosphatase
MAVILGTIPICVVGFGLKHLIEGAFRSNTVIAVTQIVMALGLIVAERVTRKTRPLEQVTIGDGFVVGGAQCLALVPGASRSGSTLIGAFLTGLEREAALRFSFLLSIPAVLLSGVYEFVAGFIKHEPLPPGAPPVMVWTSADLLLTTVVAGLVGYASIAFLLRYLARHSTMVFVVYRILLGIVLLYLISRGLIPSQ